jgi:PKD repeat protein
LLVACCLATFLSGCSWLTPDLAPVAVITATPSTGKAPLVVRLSGSLSEDDTGILEYSWEFPDHESAQMAGVQGEQSFEKSGDYIVRLTVTDSAGQSNATEVLIQVENTSPVASARFSNDAPIPGESVLFDASSSFDPDGQLIDFIWDFGDGETRRGTRVSHVYSQLGLYEVRLTVVDNAGALSTIAHTMTVHTQSIGGGCGG